MVQHPGPDREFAVWAKEKRIKWIGVDCGSADHPMNTIIRNWMPRQAAEADKVFQEMYGTTLEARFTPDKYQLMHIEMFPHLRDDETMTVIAEYQALRQEILLRLQAQQALLHYPTVASRCGQGEKALVFSGWEDYLTKRRMTETRPRWFAAVPGFTEGLFPLAVGGLYIVGGGFIGFDFKGGFTYEVRDILLIVAYGLVIVSFVLAAFVSYLVRNQIERERQNKEARVCPH
jgi:hypothetical protein